MEKVISESALGQFAQVRNLAAAWHELNKSNPQSQGVDKVTIYDFKRHLDKNLHDLSRTLLNKKFTFARLKPVTIPKDRFDPSRGTRLLQIPTIRDRVVLKALQNTLQPKFEVFNAPFSFAYRPNVGAKKYGVEPAVGSIISLAKTYPYALEADLQKYFDTVPKEKLLYAISKIISRSSLDPIIKGALQLEAQIKGAAGSEPPPEVDFFRADQNGIPQGSALSPLLANFFLAPFDLFMTRLGFKLIRYADDIVIFTESEEQAKIAFGHSEKILNALGLGIHPLIADQSKAKTRIRWLTRQGLETLGFRIEQGKVMPGSKSMRNFNHEVKGLTNPATLGHGVDGSSDFDVRDNILARMVSLGRKVEGKAASLRMCDDCPQIDELDKLVKGRFFHLLGSAGLDLSSLNGRNQIKFGVPRFRRNWRRQSKRFVRRDASRVNDEEVSVWREKVERLLFRCFPVLENS